MVNCPVCEDKGRVSIDKPMEAEVDGIEFDFTEAVPCPVCLAGLRLWEKTVIRVKRLDEAEQ